MIAFILRALFGSEESERERLRRAALREEMRQEQDAHPAERTDWSPYRRQRPGRLRRPYTGEAL